MLWSENAARLRIKAYEHDEQVGTVRKKAKGRPSNAESKASLVLMYLALGEDNAYNMEKVFTNGITKKNGWNKEQEEAFRSLKDKNQLHTLLERMEEVGFLISEKSPSGRKQRNFRLNPAILISPDGSENYQLGKEVIISDNEDGTTTTKEINNQFYGREGILRIPDELINEFLNKLKDENKEINFKQWSQFAYINFYFFIFFLYGKSREYEMYELFRGLKKYVEEIKDARMH